MDFQFTVALPRQSFASEEIGGFRGGYQKIESLAVFLGELEKYEQEVPKVAVKHHGPPPRARAKAAAEARMRQLAEYNPYSDPNVMGDVHCTVFVGRLNYKTKEEQLRSSFSKFGTIESISIVKDGEGDPKGYAFVVFRQASDARKCIVAMNGKMVDGARVVCDVERGRLVKNWKPRRLGGGVGKGRRNK